MAVTISGKNYTQISSCNSGSAGGTWSGSPTIDTDNYKEGGASISDVFKSSGDNDWTFTPTASVDLSGTKHLRLWVILTQGSLINVQSSGGVQLGISDGSNTGYYYAAGSDTYPGGWYNLVVDVSGSVDAGTKPTNMNAITSIILRINLTGTGKNVDNTWVDNLCVCDGLIAYGDDGGSYFDFEDIYQGDLTSLGIGIIRKIGGVYYLTGSLDFGDASGSNGCKFQAKSQVVVFEDRSVNSSLYGFNIVDNGTGTTEFILGDKVGSAGVQGCIVRTQNESQTPKFYIDGSTDTDVDNFKLYGTTFFDGGAMSFPSSAANVEILNCSFESCLQIDPSSASISYCYFINTSDTDSALLWNESISISNCFFIGNTAGAGIEHPAATGSPYGYNNMVFSGNTYDVYNSSGSAISVTKTGTSNPSTYEGSTVSFVAAVAVTITVKNKNTLAVIQNAQTSVWKTSDRTQIMNEDTNASGIATENYTGTTPVEVEWRVRKSDSLDDPRYFANSGIDTIQPSIGLALTVLLEPNPFLT